MRIGDVMTRQVETTRPGATLQAAARQMREAGVGLLPVIEEERLLGVITDRDIVVRAVAQGLDPAQALVRDAMTSQAFCCHEDEPLREASLEMESRAVRRLLVLDEQECLVGLISLDDLATVESDEAGEVLERITTLAPPDGSAR